MTPTQSCKSREENTNGKRKSENTLAIRHNNTDYFGLIWKQQGSGRIMGTWEYGYMLFEKIVLANVQGFQGDSPTQKKSSVLANCKIFRRKHS
jgi:hypothetical protein